MTKEGLRHENKGTWSRARRCDKREDKVRKEKLGGG